MNQRTLTSRCQRPVLNPRHASLVSGGFASGALASGVLDSAALAFGSLALGFLTSVAAIKLRTQLTFFCDWGKRVRREWGGRTLRLFFSAKGQVLSEACFAGFFVSRAHVAAGVREGFDRGI